MSEQIYSLDEIFAAVLPLLKKYHAERAILFGSYARQEADAASDIDLLVVGGKDFDLTDVLCIAEELHCALGKPRANRYSMFSAAQSAFYDTILAEGVQIA